MNHETLKLMILAALMKFAARVLGVKIHVVTPEHPAIDALRKAVANRKRAKHEEAVQADKNIREGRQPEDNGAESLRCPLWVCEGCDAPGRVSGRRKSTAEPVWLSLGFCRDCKLHMACCAPTRLLYDVRCPACGMSMEQPSAGAGVIAGGPSHRTERITWWRNVLGRAQKGLIKATLEPKTA